jgi:hypothetical protein
VNEISFSARNASYGTGAVSAKVGEAKATRQMKRVWMYYMALI